MYTNLINKLFFPILLGLVFTSCKPDAPVDPKGSGNVFILNEGNFQAGNASIDQFDPKTSLLSSDVFSSRNQIPLGDVLQSMTIIGDKGYIVVNNSQKIEVVTLSDLAVQNTITGFTSPRFLLQVSSAKAYVSDLFGGAVSIVDLNTNTITGSIALPGWTEEMLLAEGRVFITNLSSEYVYVVDPATDQVVDSVEVGLGSNSLRLDKQGRLWVLSSGDSFNGIAGTLSVINPSDLSTLKSFTFTTSDYPVRLSVNPDGDRIYYLNNGLYEIAIDATTLPAAPKVLSGEGSYFYGLGVDPVSGTLYVADALDFSQRGLMLRFEESGTAIDTFRAGVIPSGFVFVEE
ncbi:MAG: YncE family protein [Bacteroidia bacterium]